MTGGRVILKALTVSSRVLGHGQVVDRARREDLDKPLQYPCRFVRNSQGQPVIDSLFNTVSLLDVYMGPEGVPSDAVQWDIDNPNDLELHLPGKVSSLLHAAK